MVSAWRVGGFFVQLFGAWSFSHSADDSVNNSNKNCPHCQWKTTRCGSGVGRSSAIDAAAAITGKSTCACFRFRHCHVVRLAPSALVGAGVVTSRAALPLVVTSRAALPLADAVQGLAAQLEKSGPLSHWNTDTWSASVASCRSLTDLINELHSLIEQRYQVN